MSTTVNPIAASTTATAPPPPTIASEPRPVAPAAAAPPPSAALDPLVEATNGNVTSKSTTSNVDRLEALVERAEAAIAHTVDRAIGTAQPIANTVSTKAQELVRELHLPELRDTVVGGAQQVGEAVRRGSAGYVAPGSPTKAGVPLMSEKAVGKRPEGSTLTTQIEPVTAAPSSLAAQGQNPRATVPITLPGGAGGLSTTSSLGEQTQGFLRRASATMAQIGHQLEQLGDKAMKQVEEAFADTQGTQPGAAAATAANKSTTTTTTTNTTSAPSVASTAVLGSAPPPHNELKKPWNKPEESTSATASASASGSAPAIATTTNTVPHAS